MTPLDDCCWTCATCSRVVCADNETDCGHDDQPTCGPCCNNHHADELLREALRDWGRDAEDRADDHTEEQAIRERREIA